jgi:hypothetical protein
MVREIGPLVKQVRKLRRYRAPQNRPNASRLLDDKVKRWMR